MKRFRYGKAEDQNRIGQVTGLALTEVGGELLTIEAAVVPVCAASRTTPASWAR